MAEIERMLRMSVDQIEVFIPFAIRAYFFAYGRGWISPKQSDDKERRSEFREKYGGVITVLSVVVMAFGFLKLLGVAG